MFSVFHIFSWTWALVEKTSLTSMQSFFYLLASAISLAMQLLNWGASVVFRHPAGFKGTATGGYRDGRIVEEGCDVA
ncbi:MAG: hypothetical protein OSB69_15255, partial [Alphaproteobacteria bacterium]|nr:hypothetical protein [Alphaproteobacteria bacterium]